MKTNNQNGVALITSLLVTSLVVAFGSSLLARTANEKNIVESERKSAKAFYLADGAADAGRDKLDQLINYYLSNKANNTQPNVVHEDVISAVITGHALDLLVEYVVDENDAPLLTKVGSTIVYDSGTITLTTDEYFDYKIVMTEKAPPAVVGTIQYDFPMKYEVQATGNMGSTDKKILITGDFTIRFERDSFGKFALFTEQQKMKDGITTVWQTSHSKYTSGLVHTNTKFNFKGVPSAYFADDVSQADELVRFYDDGIFPVLLDASSNPGKDEPQYQGNFDKGSNHNIGASWQVDNTTLVQETTAGQTFLTPGVHLANDGTNLLGGIYVNGNSDVTLSVDGSNNAVYTFVQSGVTQTVTVDTTNDGQTSHFNGVTTTVYQGIPDGVTDEGTVIHVNGAITSLSGTVQNQTAVTVSSEHDIFIKNHIRYADYTPGVGTPGSIGYVPPNAVGTSNILGIVSWESDVHIDTSAPNDLQLAGLIYARKGEVKVDSYDDTGTGARGQVTLFGSIVSRYYGGFGTSDDATGALISGYSRNIANDERMETGYDPPYMVKMRIMNAFTHDISDKISWQEVLNFD